MSIKKFSLFIFIITCFLSSCKEENPTIPIIPEDNQENYLSKSGELSHVKVLSRNLYVGADVDKIMQVEDPNEIPIVVAEVFQSLLATNFPNRAQALAEEIVINQPDLIGLQEVSLIRMQSPGDAVVGGTTPAETVVLDYLDILLNTMAANGLDYKVAAKIENADVEMPMVISAVPEFNDVRLTDYDVILVKQGIEFNKVVEKNFRAKVSLPELGIDLPRGYVAITATVNNQKFRFVNTHLEDADQGGDLLKIQMAQAAELLLRLSRTKIPVILVGDFNSAAPSELTYRLVTFTNRFQDTWLINTLMSNQEGYTYGHDLDLLNATQNFTKRIDYVFVRNGRGRYNRLKLNTVIAEVVGDEINDKTSFGLWPSDHGGVSAELIFSYCEKKKHLPWR